MIPCRSAAALAELERLQLEESTQSGLARNPSDDPRVIRDIAQRQLMAERLDRPDASSSDLIPALVNLVGEPSYEAAVDRRVRELEEHYIPVDGDIWSRYERPDHRRRLSELVAKVEKAVAERGHTIARRPVIGTLMTGDVNAQARPGPPGEGHIVVFESGMFSFLSLLGTIATQVINAQYTTDHASLTFLQPQAIGGHIARHPGIILQFSDLLFSQAVLGTSMFSAAYHLSPENQPFCNDLIDGMQTFILAHEYGHVVLGHTDLPARRRMANPRDLEFQADRVGLDLTGSIHGRHWAFVGGAVFLDGVTIVQRAAATFLTGRDEVGETPTHPLPAERRKQLAALLNDGREPETAAHFTRMTDSIAFAFDRLWAFTKRAFEQAHQSGMKPGDFRPRDESEKRAALEGFMAAGLGPSS